MNSNELENLFDALWPINRSILGEGFDASIDLICERFQFELDRFDTGTQVFDWTIPKAWRIRSGFIKDDLGRTICDYSESNLTVMSHSIPIDEWMTWDELEKHIFTLEDQQAAIPYVTSYYKDNWGFCISSERLGEIDKSRLFHAYIDAEKYNGSVCVATSKLGPETGPVISLSSYLCHPSMANNELSGPLVLLCVLNKLSAIQDLRFRYEFHLFPETIGSLCLLSQQQDSWRTSLVGGIHLTCVGDTKPHTIKHSRRRATFIDKCLEDVFSNKGSRFVPFDPAFGSDDRQFCAPDFNLPYCSISRSIYTEYPEYHTSLDNKALMDFEGMVSTAEDVSALISNIEKLPTFETIKYERLDGHGEPQLSKRSLFRDASVKRRSQDEITMWWVLNYSDAIHHIYDIASLSGLPVADVQECSESLVSAGLLKRL